MSDDQRPSPTPRYRTALDTAAGLARDMGHSHVGVEHLFLAIIRDRDAVPTQALARMIDPDQVEASLREVITSPSYAGGPPAGAVWLPASELPDLLPALATCVAPGIRYGFNFVEEQAWIMVSEPGDTNAAIAAARALIEQGPG